MSGKNYCNHCNNWSSPCDNNYCKVVKNTEETCFGSKNIYKSQKKIMGMDCVKILYNVQVCYIVYESLSLANNIS